MIRLISQVIRSNHWGGNGDIWQLLHHFSKSDNKSNHHHLCVCRIMVAQSLCFLSITSVALRCLSIKPMYILTISTSVFINKAHALRCLLINPMYILTISTYASGRCTLLAILCVLPSCCGTLLQIFFYFEQDVLLDTRLICAARIFRLEHNICIKSTSTMLNPGRSAA